MKPYGFKLYRKAAAVSLVSSNFAIGTASAFAVLAATLGLVVDRPAPPDVFAGWVLRGALGPATPVVPPTHAASQKVPLSG